MDNNHRRQEGGAALLPKVKNGRRPAARSVPAPLRLELACGSHAGGLRLTNEDVVEVVQDVGGLDALLVVADGMGGHFGGDVAARKAVEAVVEQVKTDGRSGCSVTRMRRVLDRANQVVYQASMENPAWRGMGTTLIFAGIAGRRAAVVNVGDSPAYLVRPPAVTMVSEDHSWPAEQARIGLISPEAVRNHPLRHRLTRAIGIWEKVDCAVTPVSLRVGDMLVLCTDGVEGAGVGPERMSELLKVPGDNLPAAVRELIRVCWMSGAPDNITVAVARVLPGPAGVRRAAPRSTARARTARSAG